MRLIFCLAVSTFFCYCNPPVEKEEVVQKKKTEPKVNMGDCIKKTIYYKKDVNLDTYDSIDTRYFSKMKDYLDQDARKANKLLQEDLALLQSDSISKDPSLIQNLKHDIDSLKTVLKNYKKEVIGYVFIHTFSSEQDTMSMIIVMDKYCNKSEAIPVKQVMEINPDDFHYALED